MHNLNCFVKVMLPDELLLTHRRKRMLPLFGYPTSQVQLHNLYCFKYFHVNLSEIFTKILGLDICADTLVGDEMLKGISGGQKKRLTTGNYTDILMCSVFFHDF